MKVVNPGIPAAKGALRFVCYARCKATLELEESDLRIVKLHKSDPRKTGRLDVWFGCSECNTMNVVTSQVSRALKSRLIKAAREEYEEIRRRNERMDAERTVTFSDEEEIVQRLCSAVDTEDLRRKVYLPFAKNIVGRPESGRALAGLLWAYMSDLPGGSFFMMAAELTGEGRILLKLFHSLVRALIDDEEIFADAMRSREEVMETEKEMLKQAHALQLKRQQSN